jgi:hypothetical protein
LSSKCWEKDLEGLLALILFAGINFDEELFLTKIVEETFKDIHFCECLPNLSSLLFGIMVDNVRNTLITFLKFEILICFVRQQESHFLEEVCECCMNTKSLLNVVLKTKFSESKSNESANVASCCN